jgi:hypothetical protein
VSKVYANDANDANDAYDAYDAVAVAAVAAVASLGPSPISTPISDVFRARGADGVVIPDVPDASSSLLCRGDIIVYCVLVNVVIITYLLRGLLLSILFFLLFN